MLPTNSTVADYIKSIDTRVGILPNTSAATNVVGYIGSLPNGSTATSVVGYVDTSIGAVTTAIHGVYGNYTP